VYAQDEARTLRHGYIGTEHILLGLLNEQDGDAARVLDSLGVTLSDVRSDVTRIVGERDDAAPGQLPFTSAAKKVLESALRESLSFGDNHVGSAHILLGLLHGSEDVATRVLRDHGADADRVRQATIDFRSGPAVRESGS